MKRKKLFASMGIITMSCRKIHIYKFEDKKRQSLIEEYRIDEREGNKTRYKHIYFKIVYFFWTLY